MYKCIKSLVMKVGGTIEAAQGWEYDISKDGSLYCFIDESGDLHHLEEKDLIEYFEVQP